MQRAMDDLKPEADGAVDLERRCRLRLFLTNCRNRARPGDFGLPETRRRRVPGLRRGEVAELIGVTVDWYRSFESGRSVRVSPRFVGRLSRALGLTVQEQIQLFRLAIPELYAIYPGDALETPCVARKWW